MTLSGKIRRLGFHIRDYLINKKEDSVCYQWKNIEKILSDYNQGWAETEKNLQNILDYATENSDFYKSYKNKPFNAFPVVNKIILTDNFEKIRVKKYSKKDLHIMRTSGSTGTPFEIVQDMVKRNRVLAELKYFGNIAGYKTHEKMLFFRAHYSGSFWKQFWSNVWQPESSNLSHKNVIKMFEYQQNSQAILSYASTLHLLAKDYLDNKEEYDKLHITTDTVKAIFSGSELLSEDTRQLCKKVWKNAEVYSRYSNMENGILGQEDFSDNKKVFKLNWASYYFEVLKMDSDEPANYGEMGRIVITDFFNKAFPMIRYDTGDLGIMEKDENAFPYMIEISGRKMNILYATNGDLISPNCLGRLMHNLTENIKQWQFIQTGEKEYCIKCSCEDRENGIASMNKKIDSLKETFGQDAKINIIFVDEIPVLNSGKRKHVVQEWKQYH